ncbi:MAG: hypothetical protein GX610_00720 [Rhodococcus sp.]|nr:hypothetical protein [Rhodococcus sp. (in: high G+C Gram-positive bacteria)]
MMSRTPDQAMAHQLAARHATITIDESTRVIEALTTDGYTIIPNHTLSRGATAFLASYNTNVVDTLDDDPFADPADAWDRTYDGQVNRPLGLRTPNRPSPSETSKLCGRCSTSTSTAKNHAEFLELATQETSQ